MIRAQLGRYLVNAIPTAAVRSVPRLLPWLCVLGALACTKNDAATPSRTKTEPAQLAPARVETTTPGSDTAQARSISTQGPPTQITPAAPAPAPSSVDDPYPIQVFKPFAQRFAGDAVDPFDGATYHVRFNRNQKWLAVSSCDVLLALPLTNEPGPYLKASTELEQNAFWSTAVDCLALRLVRGAQPAQRSRLAPLLSSKDPARLLPPQLGMVDFDDERKDAQAAAAKCQSWKSFDSNLRITKKGAARFAIRAEDWTGELEFYARGDLNGDGDEDVLVRRDGGATGGSYGGSALFVVSHTASDSCIRVARALGSS